MKSRRFYISILGDSDKIENDLKEALRTKFPSFLVAPITKPL